MAAWLAGVISAVLFLLAIWFLAYAFVLSGVQENHSQHLVYASLRSEIAELTAPPFQVSNPSDNVPLGAPVAILRVPQAGISDVVLEGTTSGVLEQGPGLWPDTPLPGQAGVSVILGRQTMFGGPFSGLTSLRRGDLIGVTTGQGTFTYVVSDLRYPGQREPARLRAGQGRLTLVTAAGSGWRALGAPNKVLYVDATLRGKPAAYPGGAAASIPASEMIMHGDTSVVFRVILWLQLLIVVIIAVILVSRRWGGWRTWLVGAPAILGVLWIVSDTAFQLLPNLL
jgi:sortase A